MQTAAVYSSLWRLALLRLTGPVFDKELRVASRQRRHYLLRFGYTILLTLFVVYVWLAATRFGSAGSSVVQISRMSEAGKYIITGIIWFQFITGQFLTVVLLSGAVNSEVRQRTLESLLVTPISGLQIVLGKLLSKMILPVLLLAVSLPLLTVVRVFGGVSWAYVVSGLCLTFSAMVFVGSLSLLLSVTDRQAHTVATNVIAACLILWAAVPFFLMILSEASYLSRATASLVLMVTNPFAVMIARTGALLSASGGRTAEFWPFHCLILLAVVAVFLLLAVWRVRRVTLVSILTRARGGPAGGSKTQRAEAKKHRRDRARAGAPIRRVQGKPIVWKELRRAGFPTRLRAVLTVGFAIVAFVAMTVVLVHTQSPVGVSFLILAQILQLLFLLRLAVSAAGAITREKEARTWPILLAAPLDNKEIIWGKAVGIFRWNLSLLIPLCVLYILGYLLSPGPNSALRFFVSTVTLAFGLGGSIVFLLGLGLYLSTRLKTTAGAVAATLGVYMAPKLFCCGGLSPLFLLSVRAFGPHASAGSAGMFLLPFLFSLGLAVVYIGFGWLFARAAAGRLRRNVFG